jgi:hypothetical protein
METTKMRKNTLTVTGVFANEEDAENAYHLLMELGYTPEEVTLIMSNKTGESLLKHDFFEAETLSEADQDREEAGNNISDAIDTMGKFVSFPGCTLIVAGDFKDGGIRAVAESVMSDEYAEFYQNRVREGEIIIDLTPHNLKEISMITDLWENFRGYPLIRRSKHAA